MARRWNFLTGTSDLYVGKSTIFKTFLVLGVVVISSVFIWYTFQVIDELKTDTRSQVEKYVKLWQLAANSTEIGGELQFIFNEIIVKANFPIVVMDEDKNPLHWRNIPDLPYDTSAATIEKLKRVAAKMEADNGEYPLYFGETYANYFYYGDSEVINQLKMMPFIEIGIVLAFMIVGIIGFQNIRRSEERHIWVGMAKETAHQLGTPLSSLMGWLQLIEMKQQDSDSESEDTLGGAVENMNADVERLQHVAQRFSLIGSVPDLEPCYLNRVVQDVVVYYRRRLPFEGEGVQIVFDEGEVGLVPLNAELFGWVLENLTKNALQSVDSKDGRVTIRTEHKKEDRYAYIYIQDNGTGISQAAARKIFRPGFTTKKRGWGLGLTLVKRIIEEYHGGRIWLERSRPGETLFVIEIPLTS
jgi:signal transduction histidine kinase